MLLTPSANLKQLSPNYRPQLWIWALIIFSLSHVIMPLTLPIVTDAFLTFVLCIDYVTPHILGVTASDDAAGDRGTARTPCRFPSGVCAALLMMDCDARL